MNFWFLNNEDGLGTVSMRRSEGIKSPNQNRQNLATAEANVANIVALAVKINKTDFEVALS
ncbi:hypothetical protein [Bradyrhizobium sp. BRP56]|uniref:hypothetical protein n=1 Tax=Bradyrhizobium sp. BRP56 TaxID=2793819 RepID=UPI001CD7CFA0|nr:hypothetical protein [Bradyrhizobium sp. BRP56]MCA1401683.1 hypothetical protein [Bradyrhizobium sp. BRP56]